MKLEQQLLEMYGVFMDLNDLADLIKIKRQSVYQQIYRCDLKLPHIKEGKKYLFPTSGVAQYLEGVISKPD
jgi:predicted DNA-binding protein YlxM (UPF0122 family)